MYVSAEACARVAMQHQFAAASERARERRRHHRLRRVLQRHVQLLESLDGEVQFVPFTLLRGQQHQHQVGAALNVFAFVGDDHGFEVSIGFFQARVEHGDVVFAQRIHLAVEFDAQHAVAQIDQRRAGCSRNTTPLRSFAVPQRQDARTWFDRLIAVGTEIEILRPGRPVARRPIERDDAARERIFDIGRKQHAVPFRGATTTSRKPIASHNSNGPSLCP